MENLDFVTPELAYKIKEQFGSPVFVYSEKLLRKYAGEVTTFPNAFGFLPRYAMKASSNRNLLSLFSSLGIHIDASSGYEVERAIASGIPANHCSLSAQELPQNLGELIKQGMTINLCSLNQIRHYGAAHPGTDVGLRFNPGIGTGHVKRTNVGGPSSSFGIWKEDIEEAKKLCKQFNLNIYRVHTHIGSGTDIDIWIKAIKLSLAVAKEFETAHTLNLGGGFKVARVPEEKQINLKEVGHTIAEEFKIFAESTGRKLKLEIEPGSYFVVNACALLATVQDETSTGDEGYNFLKLDAGMTEVPRPFAYGSQHPMRVLPKDGASRGTKKYIVVGHCCESGDILTPAPGDPEELQERELTEARVGDLFLIGGSGAYCSSMSTKNYNSFPEAPEVMIRLDGTLAVMRKRQPLKQIWDNEVAIENL
jgi:diaminopimelate decarboxylase